MKTDNFLITVTNRDLLELKVNNVNFLFPIKEYCVGFLETFEIAEIDEKDAYILINRILDKKSILNLREYLLKLPKNIIGICFTDLGILSLVKELGISLKLIYMQTHNTTNVHSINYYLDYVDSTIISTDITKKEIDTILDNTKKPLVVPYFMRVEVMYSRRTLLSNYQENFNYPKKEVEELHESISNQNFLAVENDYGTVLYTNSFIDYRNINHANILFHYINPIGMSKKEVEEVLEGKEIPNSNSGFLYKETYYNLKEEGNERD